VEILIHVDASLNDLLDGEQMDRGMPKVRHSEGAGNFTGDREHCGEPENPHSGMDWKS
jgi:hypothetical protein